MFFKISVLRSFTNFTGKHLCWSLFLKNMQAEGLQLHKKRLQHRCSPANFAKFEEQIFLQNTSSVCFCTSGGCFCIFSKSPIKQLFRNLVMTFRNFFFSTHRLMYKKSNTFVYIFVVNCQFFQITP